MGFGFGDLIERLKDITEFSVTSNALIKLQNKKQQNIFLMFR